MKSTTLLVAAVLLFVVLMLAVYSAVSRTPRASTIDDRSIFDQEYYDSNLD